MASDELGKISTILQLFMSQEQEEGLAASLSALKPKPAKKWNIPPLQTKVLLDPHNLNIHLQTKVLNPRNLKVLSCHSN